MVGDFYHDKWQPRRWWVDPYPIQPTIPAVPYTPFTTPIQPNNDELEELKREVMEMKELLKRAIKYDEENGEPDCQMDDKMEKLAKVAEIVGIDISDVFKK